MNTPVMLAGLVHLIADQFVIPEIANRELVYACTESIVVHVNPVTETAWFSRSSNPWPNTAAKRVQVDERSITIETEDGDRMRIVVNSINRRGSGYTFIVWSEKNEPKSWGNCMSNERPLLGTWGARR